MRLKYFFTITAIIAVCGCGVNEKDIRRYGREGNVDLLVRTIDKGYQKQKRHAKVKLAIEQTVKQDDEEAWNYLLYRFDHGFTDDLISHTLLAPSSTSNLNVLQKQFLQYIQGSNYTETQALVSIAARVGIADDEIPLSVQDQLLVTLNTQTRLDSLRDLRRKAERSIGYYQDKIEKGRELGGKYFPLQGYIVAQVDLGLYEIEMAYYGSHAYLQTTETRFKGRGQFTLWAYELMEMPVTLRQEFGGFTQQWKVYREATSDQIREMREAKESLSAAEDSIVVRQKALDSLEPVISSESEAFDSALGQLTIIFEEAFGYSHVGVD